VSLLTNVVAAYPLDGDSTDAAGSLDLTAPSAPSYAAGKFSQALTRDGTTGETPVGAALFTSGSWTVSVWLRSTGGTGAVWAQLPATGVQGLPGRQGLAVFNAAVGTIVYGVAGSNTGVAAVGDIQNRWVHLVVSMDGTTNTSRLYVDGVLRSENVEAGSYGSSERFSLGGMHNVAGQTDSPFGAGAVDECVVWSRALTDGDVAVDETAGGEIAELYNSGDGLAYPFSNLPDSTHPDGYYEPPHRIGSYL
jgi:hypothetical protein